MYDEPFAGLDPISLGVVGQLIRKLNDALGITSVVVTHDVYESLKIVDYLYFVSEGRIICAGHARRRCGNRPTPSCASSSTASRTARCRSTIRRGRTPKSSPVLANALTRGVRRIGSGTIRAISRTGFMLARFFVAVLLSLAVGVPPHAAHRARDLFRGRAVARRDHGVGPVRRHGARAAGLRRAQQVRRRRFARHLRRPVAGAGARARGRRSAVREPRGQRDHRRDRPHEDDRTAVGDGDDGGRSARAHRRAALLGRRDLDAAAGRAVLGHGRVRRLPRRRAPDRRRQRHVLGQHAGGHRVLAGRHQRHHQEHRVRRSR